MEIRFNGERILFLSKTQEKVIQNDVPFEIYVVDMVRRLQYVILHSFDLCLDMNRSKWVSSLKDQGHSHIPADRNELANMGFSLDTIELNPSEDHESIVHVDQIDVFRVLPIHKKAIKKMIGQEYCHAYIKERMSWILKHKFERCMENLRKEWEPKLATVGIMRIPLDDEEFANLVFGRDEYKDRSERDKDAIHRS